LVGALGPLSAWFGGALLVSCYGFLTKHLYLSGFGFQYAQFAKSEDLGLNATEAFAFIIPAAVMALVLGWAVVGLRSWWPRIRAGLRTLFRIVAFALQFFGYIGQDLSLRAAGWLISKLPGNAPTKAANAIANRRTGAVAPTLPPAAPPVGNAVTPSLSPAILAAFVILMGLDLAGRYAASRGQIGSGTSPCRITAPLRCVADMGASALHGLGVASRTLGLSPTPARVRLIGTKQDLPQVLRAGWQGTADAPAIDIWLVDRSASYLFLEACPDEACAGEGVVLSATESATGLSFSTRVGTVEAVPAPPKPVNASVEFKASLPAEALAPLVDAASKGLAKADTKLESATAALKSLAAAIPHIPKHLDTSGQLTLAPGSSVDLAIDDRSMQQLGASLVSMQRIGTNSQRQLEQSARRFQDCLDKRHMQRNLMQAAFGSSASDLSDCYKADSTAADVATGSAPAGGDGLVATMHSTGTP
jgi:hypothetical protein